MSHPAEFRPSAGPLDLAQVRARLDATRGQEYWRSLEELAGSEEFSEMMHREFPPGASEWWDGLSRRNFLKMAAASLALAGLNACTKQPVEEIYPYVKQPEQLVLGKPLYYATTMVLGGFATGVLAKSREGHPIKVDGNPEHPGTHGGSNIWLQASILDLYDPDRSQTVNRDGEISDWALFLGDLNALLKEQEQTQGAGLRFLTETITSPALAAQLTGILRKFPRARWHQYEPLSRDAVREGARLAFGQVVETQYHFENAEIIVSLDSDFLYTHPDRLRNARGFTNARRVSAGETRMNRLYVVESTPTVTGSMADHRLPVASGAIPRLAQWIAHEAGLGVPALAVALKESEKQFLTTLVRDLNQHRGTGMIIAGEWQAPAVHALAHALNERLGNSGKTLTYTEPAELAPVNQLESLRELANEMRAGKVDALFILGGNPVYTAPADLDFPGLLPRVKRSIHLGLHLDETATLSTWHIPEAHYLESWGDARSYDGIISLQQPLLAPLYGGKTALELVGAMLSQQPIRSAYEILRAHWEQQKPWPDFEAGWRRALHDGFIPNSQSRKREVRVQMAPDRLQFPEPAAPPAPASLELCFRPDPNLWDGRFANNGWLQECPKPISKLTWDNAVLISPALAERLRLSSGDVVELSCAGRTVAGPVWIMPGQADNSVTVHLGHGRSRVGRIGSNVGFNAYPLRSSEAFWMGSGATLRKTGARHSLAATQTHHSLDSPERQVFRETTLQEVAAKPDAVQNSVEKPAVGETLYYPDEYPYDGYKWGMSIDLNTCIGCNACILACNIENNIPVVGKDQVSRNREMLWLRVDTYFKGSLDKPEFAHMPVPCMHCEHAPCELVCPTAATVHDHEGLNLQVYNRCVGTRFCSNNCPYKVRRFNFLRYAPYDNPSQEPRYNPEVTVRWRGVMEKCTYCVQRIAAGRITAEKENRHIRDGEVRTACQEACPADAIVFGDLNTRGGAVAKLKSHPLDYAMLGELNTRPRTTYLAKVRNPVAEPVHQSGAGEAPKT